MKVVRTQKTTSGRRRSEPLVRSRFELAPPRRFLLPAILLLLSESPGYGYALVPRLEQLHFGHVDRPAVYRALSRLERDELVEASSESPIAGQARRVYRVTSTGERVLRVWMGIIKADLDCFGEVLRRYQATGTTDAVLAEVEGGWSTAFGFGWSTVSATARGPGLAFFDPDGLLSEPDGAPAWPGGDRVVPVRGASLGGLARAPARSPGHGTAPHRSPSQPTRFRLIPERSVVLIEVRSTVGPLSFGAVGVSGTVEAVVRDGMVQTETPPSGQITIDVAGLRSGNGLYDAELLRRIDARRFPAATVNLHHCAPSSLGLRYNLQGALTFHGVTRPVTGTVIVEVVDDRRLVIAGEQVFDIRDFAIPSPTVLMLRIYPDVRVRLHAEAEQEE